LRGRFEPREPKKRPSPGKGSRFSTNDYAEDPEAPPEYFADWLTPVSEFFVRQHLPRPARIDPSAYQLMAGGTALSLDDLRKLPQHTVPGAIE
jgi:hypothetical protein